MAIINERLLRYCFLLGLAIVLVLASACSGGRRPPASTPTRSAGVSVELHNVLAELEALPSPPGVDERLFAQLRSALGDALRMRSRQRFVASPPEGPSNLVEDLTLVAGEGNWLLSWSYRNSGDYNQDGVVDIKDITPLAVHFNEFKNDETGEWQHPVDEVVDGNGDGAITIADITTLAASFFRDCAGYVVETSDNPNTGFQEFQRSLLEDASGEGRLQFTVLLPVLMEDPYIRVVPVDAQDTRGDASNVVGVPGMALSVIDIQPRGGLAGSEVQFTATIDGVEPISYLWDFGEGAEPNSSNLESPTVTLGGEGSYDASLTLSNDYGDYTYEFTLTVGTSADAPVISGVSPGGGIAGQDVRFSVEASGVIPFAYLWDFGDAGTPSTADVASPLVKLGDPGSYDASVTVSNYFGSDTFNFTVEVGSIGSTPRITNVTPAKAAVGDDVVFFASVTGNGPFTYFWDFGAAAEPSTYTDASPTVHIVSAGMQEASVTVANVYGEDTRQFTVDVGLAPVIDSVDHGQLVTTQEATFSVTISAGDGPFVHFWDFGGGAFPNTSSEESPTVTMGDPGAYQGTVSVGNYYGLRDFDFDFVVEGIGPTINSVSPVSGTAGAGVTFIPDFTGTPPVSFNWNFGGGVDPNTSTDERPTGTLLLGGFYYASVTAQNTWGMDTLNFDLRVGVRASVDSGSKGIGGLSLSTVNGRPAVAYYDASAADLLYCRANDEWGNSWGTPVQIETTGDVGQYVSLAVVDGYPAVSYVESVLGHLKYARATDVDGTAWGTPVAVDGSGGVAGSTTLLVVSDRPAISYYGGSQDLMYVRANDATGSAWGTPQTVYSTGDVGQYASMAIVNGNPAIAFYDASNGDAAYVRATDATGLSWGTPVPLSTDGDVGAFSSLAVVGGYPAASFFDQTNGNLQFVIGFDIDGTGWRAPVVAVGSGLVGGYVGLLEVGGFPAIAFNDRTDDDLGYVLATDAEGVGWNDAVLADTAGSTGNFNSGIIMSDGRPALATVELVGGEVRYILANDAMGNEWPAP